MPEPDSSTRAAYDRIAPQFAQVNAVMPPELAEAAGRLIQQLPPGAKVLDLGCGAGRDLAWMETRSTADLFGVDLSAAMLTEAKRITRAPLCQMDMRVLGFASEIFDAVWCMAALLHLPKRQAPAALNEMARVLKPGGLLFLTVQAGEGEVIERGMFDDPTVERFFARYTPPELSALLQSTGFGILRQGENTSHRSWLRFEAQKHR